MKFTAYEAMGIQPLVAHSPLLNWMYDFLSVRSFSTMLGFLEIGTAVLIALRSVSPTASAVGSVLAIGLFATTLSFLFATPGWGTKLGVPRAVGNARTVPAQRRRLSGRFNLVIGRGAEGCSG